MGHCATFRAEALPTVGLPTVLTTISSHSEFRSHLLPCIRPSPTESSPWTGLLLCKVTPQASGAGIAQCQHAARRLRSHSKPPLILYRETLRTGFGPWLSLMAPSEVQQLAAVLNVTVIGGTLSVSRHGRHDRRPIGSGAHPHLQLHERAIEVQGTTLLIAPAGLAPTIGKALLLRLLVEPPRSQDKSRKPSEGRSPQVISVFLPVCSTLMAPHCLVPRHPWPVGGPTLRQQAMPLTLVTLL
jgi:hypothetical protein